MQDKRHRGLVLLITTLLFAIVPFLFWRATWFGRKLTDKEITLYLSGDKARLTQHALSQLADRLIDGSLRPEAAAEIYPRVTALAAHPSAEIRCTAAWTMGQDNTSEEFHQALVKLIRDPEPLVRRNAALSLVRFSDSSSRDELLGMLQPYVVRSEQSGVVSFRLRDQDTVNPGTLLARITPGSQATVEIRSPLPGRIQKRLVPEGQLLAAGDAILLLSPAPEQVWEALRALVLVGRPDDLPDVERLARSSGGENDRIRQQALMTAQAIKNRL